MRWREYLRLSRVHTASLTIPGVLLGAYLAGARDPLLLTLFAVWGLLYHAQGFIHNNLQDLEHDREQATEKSLFPLVRGTITPKEATLFFLLLHALTLALGLILILAGNGVRPVPEVPLALLTLTLAVLAGFAYNHASKKTTFAPIYICTSFAALPLFAWYAAGGHPWGIEGWYLFAYGWLLMLPQIAVSGYIKDLDDDPVNLMRDRGARVKHDEEAGHCWVFPSPARDWAWGARAPSLVLAVAWTWFVSKPLLVPVLGLIVAVVYAHHKLLWDGWIPREEKVRWMAMEEVLVYWLLVLSLTPHLGVNLATAFAVGPFVWFVLMNLIMWGRAVSPRV